MPARANVMGRSQAVLGDRTTHDGVIFTGNPLNTWYGLPVARKTDKVFCPKCKPHIFEIADGVDTTFDGNLALPLAVSGSLTTCGALIIAESAPSAQLKEVLHFISGTGFDDRYVLRDDQGHPLSNAYYALKKLEGELEFGTTDEAGHTHLCLTGEEASQVDFYLAG